MRTLEIKRVSIEIPFIDMDDFAWHTGFLVGILFAIGGLFASFFINPKLPQTPIQLSDFLYIFIALLLSFIFGWMAYVIRREYLYVNFRHNNNVLGTKPIISHVDVHLFKNQTISIFFPIVGDINSVLPYNAKPERPIVAVHYKNEYLLFETI